MLRREKRPEQVVGELAYLSGLTEQNEPVAARELIPLFDWEKIKREDIAL